MGWIWLSGDFGFRQSPLHQPPKQVGPRIQLVSSSIAANDDRIVFDRGIKPALIGHRDETLNGAVISSPFSRPLF